LKKRLVLRMAEDKQCIFCRIIDGEIPSKKVYEDDSVLAILDINPAIEGHTIILPKKHYQIMPQIPEKEIGHLFKVAKKISHAILRGMMAQGTSVFVANGAVAGQKSPHFMIHVFQRKGEDGLLRMEGHRAEEKELDAALEAMQLKLGTKRAQQPAQPAPAEKKSDDVDLDDITRLFT